MRTEYKYQVGEVVNETLKIVSKTTLPNGRYKRKAYEVQSLVYPDAPTYVVDEYNLKRGQRCSYKAGKKVYEGNSLYSIKHLRPYLIDIEEAKTISPGSDKKYKFKCSCCTQTKVTTPNKLTYSGFSCPKCSKGTSYPELFMMAYLEVKGIEYEYQKVFDDLPNRRFDFYLPKENKVIETHGIQHYKMNQTLFSYKDTLKSDTDKVLYCKENYIGFIEIDSRKSNFKYIKNSINSSILPNIVGGDYILINKIIESNKRYPVKDIVSMYVEGSSSSDIGLKFNLHPSTVLRILNRVGIKTRKNYKRIICTTTGEVFKSITVASKLYNIPTGNLVKVLKGKRKYAGKHLTTGEPLIWEYVD